MAAARWWNAPNLLTISRLFLAPVIVADILLGYPVRALVLLVAAGLTDLLDGYLARRTGSQSEFGQLIDPIADKVLLSGVFLGLGRIGTVPAWFVIIVLGRDLVLLIASAIVLRFQLRADLRPNLLGKGGTILQILTAGTFVAANARGGGILMEAGEIFLWPTALLTVASGALYGWRGVRTLNGEKGKGENPVVVDDGRTGE